MVFQNFIVNHPALWASDLEHVIKPSRHTHKYKRGSLVVFGGGAHTSGAARLCARSALRLGAGVVTLGAPLAALDIYAIHETAIMIAGVDTPQDVRDLLHKKRARAAVIGPGCGVFDAFHERAVALLESSIDIVLDADALTVFQGQEKLLKDLVKARGEAQTILTPHAGEFEKLFNVKAEGEAAARKACEFGVWIVLKGPITFICPPDESCTPHALGYQNTQASPFLATAGSGDCLAGAIGGFLAQGVCALSASLAAVYCHGLAGDLAGFGLTAEDLPSLLPRALMKSFEVLKES